MSVLIFGYGTTGKSIESYLVKNNINYFIFDDNEEAIVGKRNKFTLNRLDNIDLVYISPGISPSHSLYKQLKNKNIEIKTDLDLFF
jgi:UDP-N-acetylmuramoylalanine-D-glutamate ligase